MAFGNRYMPGRRQVHSVFSRDLTNFVQLGVKVTKSFLKFQMGIAASIGQRYTPKCKFPNNKIQEIFIA